MSDVTLKSIEELFDKKLKPLETKVQSIETKVNNLDGKADRTAVLVANLVEDFHEVPATLKSIVQTLNSHTAVLEQLLTKKKIKDEEKTVFAERFERLEQ